MTATAHPDSVLIIDFGSQVTQLIARRVREAGVYCEIVPFQSAEEGFARLKPKAVILSGGPASTHEAGSPRAPQTVIDSGLPMLGICYGQMTMCVQMGGEAEASDHREFGRAYIEVVKDCPLFEDVWGQDQRHQVWMSHGDRVIELPKGFEIYARSEGAPFAVFGDVDRETYGMMFHPEVVHTPDGAKLLSNFVASRTDGPTSSSGPTIARSSASSSASSGARPGPSSSSSATSSTSRGSRPTSSRSSARRSICAGSSATSRRCSARPPRTRG